MLPPVSQGYPADRGGLHTRYAPVRHSHGPEGPLPYDLHVLGLPLAFILSQDQTLRCIIDFLVFFSVVSGPPSLLSFGSLSAWRPPHGVTRRHAILCWPQAIKELPQTSRRFHRPLSLVCGLQRYDPFPNRQALFSKISHPTSHLADLQLEKFYGKGEKCEPTPLNYEKKGIFRVILSR